MKVSKEFYEKVLEMKENSEKLGLKSDLKMGRVCIPSGTGFGDGYKCAVNTIFNMIERVEDEEVVI